MLVALIIAFNLGLFSTVHCVGMCGGILTAMMFAGPETEQKNKLKIFNRSLAYNSGRISSYSIAGLLSGLLGMQFTSLFQNSNAHLILQSIAALVLIGLALNILGVLPFKKVTESFGMIVWKRIQPLGKHFYPVNSLSRAFLLGLFWGWLPCGLVYSALLLSLSAGTPVNGMLIMFFFGLGTLPAMLTAGYFSDYLNRVKTNSTLKIITAVLMILIAISLPVSTFYFSGHHEHGVSNTDSHQHHLHH
jgi:uncharacterized protein